MPTQRGCNAVYQQGVGKCMREDWMFLDNSVGIQGKTKSRLEQEEPGRSYCDFLMFVHQRTREGYWTPIWQEILIGFTNQWGGHAPMTTLIYLWRTRLTVRPQDFHSWNSSSILLCATNKNWKRISAFRNLRGNETDRNSWNMDVQKSFEANLNIVGFDFHARYQVKQ